MNSIGPVDFLLLLAIGLAVLGPGKLPEVARLIMRAYRGLRSYVSDLKRNAAGARDEAWTIRFCALTTCCAVTLYVVTRFVWTH